MAKVKTELGPGDTPFDMGPPQQQPEAKAQKGMICQDAELVAMQKISRIIDKLPGDKAKIRVIEWLKSKIEFPLVDQTS